VKNGRTQSWEQAMAEFRDATGRPGPATWEIGTYKEGQAEFPIGGVSWYEAAAYAEFAARASRPSTTGTRPHLRQRTHMSTPKPAILIWQAQ